MRTIRSDATLSKAKAEKIASDMQAVSWVVRFYRDKLQAAPAKTRCDTRINRNENRGVWFRELPASVDDFRRTDQPHVGQH